MTAQLPDRAQVVIIGGGVTGCSIAYHLASLGWNDVVLLERKQLTSGTTWHAAGLITSAGMADETLLWMSRYSRDLYERLESETGLATGFRAVGHLHLATTPERLETLRREAAFVRGFGVDNQEISAREFSDMWPEAKADDVLAAFYVADEGRANPADVAMSLARGARQKGVHIAEGVSVTGVEASGGRVQAVLTDTGGRIECEYVVNAGGMWARQIGALSGVSVPLQAAEHYYMITEPVPWAHRDLPVVEDPDRYGYYREEVGGILVGLFEPVAAPWSLDGVDHDLAFTELPPDWERTGPYLDAALGRIPSLREAGIRLYFCGPESFTSDVHPLLGESPELSGYFVAAGMNSLGILMGGGVGSLIAQWIVDGVPPLDVSGVSVERTQPFEATRKFRAERTVELLGILFGDGVWPNWQPSSARGIRRSVVHDRLAEHGAYFGVSAGWEFPEWFAGPGQPVPKLTLGWQRDESWDYQVAEHMAVRQAVGVLDLSLMSKYLVQGRDCEALLNRVSANNVAVEPGRLVYTQWCNDKGGIEADLTVTRLAEDQYLVVASDVIHRRVEAWLRRHTLDGEQVTITDVTSGTTILSLQGPLSRELLGRLTDADLSNEAFGYLTARDIGVGYAPVRAMRVTYVGELGWELHIPAEYGLGVYDSLVEAGEDLGLRDVGFMAMNGLRLEKGYRDYGFDIDNTDTPLDAGLGFAVAWDKPGGFVGRDALVALREQPRTQLLVQVLLEDPEPLLFGNEPVLRDGSWVGYIRAGAYGHGLGGAVGLAMLEDESGVTAKALRDWKLTVDVGGRHVPAKVSTRPLYDPERARILG
jgi:glycine cleavage system aminomethyltransferase T/glycine/D-amino acid oxidase-like deaminating enzyme